MAEIYSHEDEAKKLLTELKDKGITDLETLVRKITEPPGVPKGKSRKLFCDLRGEHFCINIPDR